MLARNWYTNICKAELKASVWNIQIVWYFIYVFFSSIWLDIFVSESETLKFIRSSMLLWLTTFMLFLHETKEVKSVYEEQQKCECVTMWQFRSQKSRTSVKMCNLLFVKQCLNRKCTILLRGSQTSNRINMIDFFMWKFNKMLRKFIWCVNASSK